MEGILYVSQQKRYRLNFQVSFFQLHSTTQTLIRHAHLYPYEYAYANPHTSYDGTNEMKNSYPAHKSFLSETFALHLGVANIFPSKTTVRCTQ